jgi:AraC-like DNA-binding protein
MPQSHFSLYHGVSRELDRFPHVKEFVLRKNSTIQLDSFPVSASGNFRVYCVIDGKFEWLINKQQKVLFPGDITVVLPGQEIGGSKGYFGIGTLLWFHFEVEKMSNDGRMTLGKWSTLLETERHSIGKIFLLNNLPVLRIKEVGGILHEMHAEIVGQEVGYVTRFNHLLDSMLIIIARQATRQASSRRDFPGTFMKLEQALRESLSHQWTVEEMAALVGLGTTAFTEKVRSFTGFSPLNYLINIRISEAIKRLKQPGVSMTDIALETGFYSSQHFSTTFKKLTGYTPGEFRKKNSPRGSTRS